MPRNRQAFCAARTRRCRALPASVFTQEGEHVRLPDRGSQRQVVPFIGRDPDGRIDLQAMRLAELGESLVQRFRGLIE